MEHKPYKIELWTDGACLGNHLPDKGVGGWAVIAVGYELRDASREDGEYEGWIQLPSPEPISGCKPEATNNEMELTAILEGLKSINRELAGQVDVQVYSDSQYCINVFTKWVKGWASKGWVKSNREPVANAELVQAIYELTQLFQPTFTWVKAHAGNEMNEQANELAQKAAADCDAEQQS